MTSIKEQGLNALALTSKTISEAIASLSSPIPESIILAEPTPTITDLNNDLQSLLSLLYAATTRATLVLKPADPHFKAALSPLTDLATNGTRLAHVGILFRASNSKYGETLAKEVVAAIQEVLDSLQSYLKVLVSEHTSASGRTRGSSSSGKGEGEEYMLRAGAVHEVVTRLKDELSRDNRTAVKKKWKADRGLLEDAVKEVGEMLEDGDGDDDDDDDDDDDGWDELGLGSIKMQEDETKRAKSFHSLLRCIATLQKRIQLDLISETSPSRKEPDPKTLDALLAHSSRLLAACDGLASSLYSPQDKSTLSTELASLLDEVRSIKEIVTPLAIPVEGDIEEKMAALQIQQQQPKQNGKPLRDVHAWFETCFTQIFRISDSISNELQGAGSDP